MKKVWAWVLSGILMGLALWDNGRAAGTETDQGKSLFETNCVICHGKNGAGDGVGAVAFSPRPADFKDPKFWQKFDDGKIADTIRKGHGMMPAFNLTPEQIKALTEYLKHFKK
jgi:mono/diheme cytochrome c family protein